MMIVLTYGVSLFCYLQGGCLVYNRSYLTLLMTKIQEETGAYAITTYTFTIYRIERQRRKNYTRLSIPLLLLLLLLTACSPLSLPNQDAQATPTAQSTLAVAPTPTTPANTTADVCPKSLRNVPGCYTPHQFRVGYGVEPLVSEALPERDKQ